MERACLATSRRSLRKVLKTAAGLSRKRSRRNPIGMDPKLETGVSSGDALSESSDYGGIPGWILEDLLSQGVFVTTVGCKKSPINN